MLPHIIPTQHFHSKGTFIIENLSMLKLYIYINCVPYCIVLSTLISHHKLHRRADRPGGETLCYCADHFNTLWGYEDYMVRRPIDSLMLPKGPLPCARLAIHQQIQKRQGHTAAKTSGTHSRQDIRDTQPPRHQGHTTSGTHNLQAI